MIHVLMVSGGKDSVAMWSWARRTWLAPRVVLYNDTEWEATKPGINHYDYLARLQTVMAEPIERSRAPMGMRALVRHKAMWPGRLKRRKYCTEMLKIDSSKLWLDELRERTGEDVTVYVAVRRDESEERAEMSPREWSDAYDCWVHRPMLDWTLKQIIDEHHDNGIPIHPLYLAGAERVGCWPCVKASKDELALLGRLDPERVDEIASIEKETGNMMFTLEEPTIRGVRGKCIATPIHDVIAWANTDRGGRQLRLQPVASGCARWGLCER